jgi:hypothetical protein
MVELMRKLKKQYIDDQARFVDVARSLGISGIIHNNYETTVAELKKYDHPLNN